MKVTRTSMLSGVTRTRELDVTPEQMTKFELRLGLVQDIFPHLPPSDREFIKTGITDLEWEKAFGWDQ